MESMEKTTIINATPKAVFEYLSDPQHLIDLLPGAVTVEDIQLHVNGALKFGWSRKLCGVRFEGNGERAEYKPFHLLTYKLDGGLTNDLCWSLKPVPSGTEVLVQMTYDEPLPLKHHYEFQSITEDYTQAVEAALRNLAAGVQAREHALES